MKRTGCLALIGVAFSCKSFAEDQQRIYRSAYFLGRGDTGIADADDQDAIFYNPAGIATGKGIFKKLVLVSPHVEISDDARNLYREIAMENDDKVEALRQRIGKPEHAGLYNFSGIIFRRAALGVVNSATADFLVYKSPEAGGLESVKASFVQNNGLTFSLAESFASDHVFVGSTFKYLQRGQAAVDVNVIDADKVKNMKSSDLLGMGYGGGMDLGLMVKGGGRAIPSCGLTVMNVGDTRFQAASENATALTDLKQTVNFGCSISPGTKVSRFKLLADYWDMTAAVEKSVYKRTHFGGELSVLDIVGVTTGLSGGASSFGFYVDVRLLRLDIGMYTQEMDDRVGVRPDRRIYARLMVGF